MNDLLMFTPKKENTHSTVGGFAKGIAPKWTKISLRKLYRKVLLYMGNTIFSKERRFCVKPLRCSLDAFQGIKTPSYNYRL